MEPIAGENPGDISAPSRATAAATTSWLIIGANVSLALPYAVMLQGHWSQSNAVAAASLLALAAAAFLGWQRRTALTKPRPAERFCWALPALGASVALYVASVHLDVRIGAGWFLVLALAAQIRLLRGHAALRAFVAPLVLAALAAPVPAFVRARLSELLLNLILSVAPGLLEPVVGPTTTAGYYLELPGGELPVVGDCSGLGSLLLAVPVVAILAVAHGPFHPLRLTALAAIALTSVFLGNLLRVLISALLVVADSPLARSTTAHELIGTACLILSLVALFFVSRCLGSRP